jgi:hypothetical protein
LNNKTSILNQTTGKEIQKAGIKSRALVQRFYVDKHQYSNNISFLDDKKHLTVLPFITGTNLEFSVILLKGSEVFLLLNFFIFSETSLGYHI